MPVHLRSIHFLTLFPELIEPALKASLMGRAVSRGLIQFSVTQIRDFSTDKHRTVDDAPYGGGEGMVLRADVLHAAWSSVDGASQARTVLLSPQGPRLTQSKARELLGYEKLILVCGHYEGVDERFIELCCDEELSIGDYVLTGGELPALVVADAVTRLVPGVVGNSQSIERDSLEPSPEGGGLLLKYPQYTKPRQFMGLEVPEVLLSGNHGEIDRWRRTQSLERTRSKRPDLLP
ncbi:MAG: tRNA (guanosine(37)-N1)-methyltransferase TrmD [Oligoflexia bacterium]